VFYDDRDERPGVKFKDADLLGFPIRVNVGGRALKEGKIEIVMRRDKSVHAVPRAEAASAVRALRDDLAGSRSLPAEEGRGEGAILAGGGH
jgi:prolyl-tRNA synthetase